jgi:uncharacterized protein YqgQ
MQSTTIKLHNDVLRIEIPSQQVYQDEYIKKFLDYLKAKAIINKSKATKDDIKTLSEEVKQNVWQSLKNSVMKDIVK